MPTQTNTYSNVAVDPIMNADDAFASALPVKLKASTTFAAGVILGEITASPGTYGAYASGNVDGTQNPAGILRRAAVTDGSSNITNYDEWGAVGLVATLFTQGTFRTADLPGLDANAVTKLGGHLVQGTVTNGVLNF